MRCNSATRSSTERELLVDFLENGRVLQLKGMLVDTVSFTSPTQPALNRWPQVGEDWVVWRPDPPTRPIGMCLSKANVKPSGPLYTASMVLRKGTMTALIIISTSLCLNLGLGPTWRSLCTRRDLSERRAGNSSAPTLAIWDVDYIAWSQAMSWLSSRARKYRSCCGSLFKMGPIIWLVNAVSTKARSFL